MPKKKKEEKKYPFYVELDYGGGTYQARGDTPVEAIRLLPQKLPNTIKARAILKLTSGEQTSETLLTVVQIKRMFVNDLYRQILEKRLLLALQ